MSSSNYLSPLCSCVFCKQLKSAKGIHSHYLTAHTFDGNNRAKQNGKLGYAAASTTIKNKISTNEAEYQKCPKKCVECDLLLPYRSRKNKFCSSTCAANFNNRRRPTGHPSRTKSNDSRRAKAKATNNRIIKSKQPKIRKINSSKCVVCSNIFIGRRKTCSDVCLHTHLSIVAKTRQTHPQNGKSILYKGIKLGSSYEYLVAIDLDKNNIEWVKPSPLKYVDPTGKERNYFPDFYLPQFNVYLDPKNDFLINYINPETGFNDIDKINWAADYNCVTIYVLNKNQLSWEYIQSLL